MRQFDSFSSYLDNMGMPLVGRVKFLELDGQTSSIYDDMGNPLPNPIYTDGSGRTERQVFLDDHDYRVVFERYVGVHSIAEMPEDIDDASWDEQGSVVNRYNVFGVDVDIDGIPSVGTMEALRELNPDVSGSIVNLLGYDVQGDKPSVLYRFVPINYEDDGGSVIRPNDPEINGRWLLVQSFTELDVRHFGAFPKETADADSVQKNSIANASAYASRIGVPLYFPADERRCYYDINGLTIDGVKSSRSARLFCTAASATLTGVVEAYAYSDGSHGRIDVYGDVLRTSFNSNTSGKVVLHPGTRVVFDTDYIGSSSWENVDCVIEERQTSGQSFTNCVISGSGRLSMETNWTFTRCRVREKFFDGPVDFGYITLDGCESSRSDWSTDLNYLRFVIENGGSSADIQGGRLEELPEVGRPFTLSGCTVDVRGVSETGPMYSFVDVVFEDNFVSRKPRCSGCTFNGSVRVVSGDDGFDAKFESCKFSESVFMDDVSGSRMLKYVVVTGCEFKKELTPPLEFNYSPTEFATLQRKVFKVADNMNALWDSDGVAWTVEVPLYMASDNPTPTEKSYAIYHELKQNVDGTPRVDVFNVTLGGIPEVLRPFYSKLSTVGVFKMSKGARTFDLGCSFGDRYGTYNTFSGYGAGKFFSSSTCPYTSFNDQLAPDRFVLLLRLDSVARYDFL